MTSEVEKKVRDALKERRHRMKCLECGDIIESKHQHDFVTCSCGNLFLDGGTSCPRVGTNGGRIEEVED